MEDLSSGGNTGGTASGSVSVPVTFADAFQPAPAESPSAEPAAQTDAPPVAAQPGSEQAASPQSDDRSPFIPRPRFDEVNAEKNALKTQFEQYKQQTAWAENQTLREAAQRIAAHQGNPLGLLSEIIQDLAQTPEGAQQLRSFLGQQFGGLRQRQTQTPQPPEADVAIYDQSGNVVGKTYSADALAQREAFLKQQWMQEVQQIFAPKLQTLETIQQEREQQGMRQQAHTFSTSFMEDAKAQFPTFDVKVHGPAVAAEIAKLQLPENATPSVVEAAGLRALMKVMLPTLSNSAQSSLLDSLQQKAAASTAVNPAAATPSTRATIRSFNDPALTW